MSDTRSIIKAAVAAKKRTLQLAQCFDPNDLDSRPNGSQDAFFQDAGKIKYRYLIGGNGSGKSQTGGRELTWLITDTHPYWQMPEDWKGRGLQVLVIGKSRSILDSELWLKKIKPFFTASDWKETRVGNSLSYVEHRTLKHRIIFLSHSDGSQKSIDNLQAYDADVVWLDEMPRKLGVLEETQRRTRRPNTIWYATFTPKSVNVKIRKMVDSAKEPVAKRYTMSRLDVPGSDPEAELSALAGLTKSAQRTILYGDWAIGEENVFSYDVESMSAELPTDYSPVSWRHVECVDPGSNRGGFTIWAEDPKTAIWYCVLATYIDGLRDPVAFYDECQRLSRPYNITRRVCDPAATPHLGHAAAQKCRPPYTWPHAKNQGRKKEMLKATQRALSQGRIKLVEGRCGELEDELSNAQWNDSGVKIINEHAYHLMDCTNYFVDMMPKAEPTTVGKSRDEILLEKDDARLAGQHKQKTNPAYRLVKMKRGKRWA